jgi:hypothetical protein
MISNHKDTQIAWQSFINSQMNGYKNSRHRHKHIDTHKHTYTHWPTQTHTDTHGHKHIRTDQYT